MNNDGGFFKGRMKGGVTAFKGAVAFFKSEHSVMVQFAFFIIFIGIGFWVGINKYEWMFQFLVFGLIFTAEALNTAIERIADFIHPEYHTKIGWIKDLAAGAVFCAFFTAISIACFIYIPYLYTFFQQ